MTTVKPTFLRNATGAATETPVDPVARSIDAVADRLGFVDRAPAPTVLQKKRKTVEEATTSFTARISVRSANEFIRWTEAHGLSYRQGFDHLMRLLAEHPDTPVQR
jgi:hypothetical protein